MVICGVQRQTSSRQPALDPPIGPTPRDPERLRADLPLVASRNDAASRLRVVPDSQHHHGQRPRPPGRAAAIQPVPGAQTRFQTVALSARASPGTYLPALKAAWPRALMQERATLRCHPALRNSVWCQNWFHDS